MPNSVPEEFTLQLPEDTRDALDEICRRRKWSPSQALNHSIIDYADLVKAAEGTRIFLERPRFNFNVLGYQIRIGKVRQEIRMT